MCPPHLPHMVSLFNKVALKRETLWELEFIPRKKKSSKTESEESKRHSNSIIAIIILGEWDPASEKPKLEQTGFNWIKSDPFQYWVQLSLKTDHDIWTQMDPNINLNGFKMVQTDLNWSDWQAKAGWKTTILNRFKNWFKLVRSGPNRIFINVLSTVLPQETQHLNP